MNCFRNNILSIDPTRAARLLSCLPMWRTLTEFCMNWKSMPLVCHYRESTCLRVISEIDVQLGRCAVRAIGRCAIKVSRISLLVVHCASILNSVREGGSKVCYNAYGFGDVFESSIPNFSNWIVVKAHSAGCLEWAFASKSLFRNLLLPLKIYFAVFRIVLRYFSIIFILLYFLSPSLDFL